MSGLNVSATQKGDEGGQTSKQVEQKARDQIGVQTSDPMILAVSMEERESAEEKRNWSEKYLKEEQQGKLGQDSRNWLQCGNLAHLEIDNAPEQFFLFIFYYFFY